MIEKNKVIVLDIDGTICEINKEKDYIDLTPNWKVVNKIREYRKDGWRIVLNTSRNMNTYDGNVGLINANTAKSLLSWLDANNIPYDEILYGKPWCGHEGFYVDDKSIRPDEFVNLEYSKIKKIIK